MEAVRLPQLEEFWQLGEKISIENKKRKKKKMRCRKEKEKRKEKKIEGKTHENRDSGWWWTKFH